jgi:acetyl-CoA acetyltransferase family protein
MNAPVIVSAVRTAIGTARKGSLARTRPEALARTVLEAVLARSGVAPELVDDVVLAESLYGGGAVARYAAVAAGLTTSGGMAVNRHCAGSLSAVGVAAGSVLSGVERFVIAGGVTSLSSMPQMRMTDPVSGAVQEYWMPDSHPDSPEAPAWDMSITVGWNTAQAVGIEREEMDAWALRSHERAIAAIDAGNFVEQIVPVDAVTADGGTMAFSIDEYPRRGTTMEQLGQLKVLHPEIEGFSITAGNSSGVNDAAAALMVTTADHAAAQGVNVSARILGWTAIGKDPRLTGLAAIDVIEKLLDRTRRKASDVALWEINEAFASVPIAACRLLGLDEELVNISGSGCSLGHPISASGGRMLTTLIHDLRRRGGGIGMAAMCAGGGQAGAVLIEV